MKTTFDLPEELVRQLKLRAVRERRKLKDLAAELLAQAMSVTGTALEPRRKPRVSVDPKTGLPLIKGKPGAPISKMSTSEILAFLQQTQEEEDLERLGASLRR